MRGCIYMEPALRHSRVPGFPQSLSNNIFLNLHLSFQLCLFSRIPFLRGNLFHGDRVGKVLLNWVFLPGTRKTELKLIADHFLCLIWCHVHCLLFLKFNLAQEALTHTFSTTMTLFNINFCFFTGKTMTFREFYTKLEHYHHLFLWACPKHLSQLWQSFTFPTYLLFPHSCTELLFQLKHERHSCILLLVVRSTVCILLNSVPL